MISIETTRYSTVVAAFAERYPLAIALLDKRAQARPISQWCTNAKLLGAINFSLRDGKAELLGFHDGPRNMWASADALALVEELAAKHVLRFELRRPVG
ncbi:hypothetical protein [Pelomonas sp. Root662]|uniref:hypothetical protein n=1 Tax=Pelomonas sp. Root662 TaxID=1736580 RepID=UPI000702A67E|nr:hypothetical protein [Pelomonas sp. Root662]